MLPRAVEVPAGVGGRDREEGADKNFKAANINLISLFKASDFLSDDP